MDALPLRAELTRTLARTFLRGCSDEVARRLPPFLLARYEATTAEARRALLEGVVPVTAPVEVLPLDLGRAQVLAQSQAHGGEGRSEGRRIEPRP